MGLKKNVFILKLFFLIFIASIKTQQQQILRSFKNSDLFIDEDHVRLITEDDSIGFFVIGDWGGLPVFPYRTIIQTHVSNQMTKLGELHNTQFQISTGDNFYYHGVIDSDDKRFKHTFEDVYNTQHLEETSWFVVLGNHDHYGNSSAQIEYMKKSKRWILPSYKYTIDIKTKNGKEDLMSILMIDTVLLCGDSGFDWQNSKEPRLESLKHLIQSGKYLESVENELRRLSISNVSYILVSGHFPVWSIAEHGPTQCLVDKLRPLLHKYKISAYLCGHDHNLQHLNDNYLDHSIDYFVSGAGNFVNNSTEHLNNIPDDSLKFHWFGDSSLITGGFMMTKADSNKMTFTFYDSNGENLYETVVHPRKLN